jgi:hypothetical protein
MRKLVAAAALALPLTVAGVAHAGEPVHLTDGQMDNVTAGGLSIQSLTQAALAVGGGTAATQVIGFAGTLELGSVTSGTTVVALDLGGVAGFIQGAN